MTNIFKSAFFMDGTNAPSMMRLVTFLIVAAIVGVWLLLNVAGIAKALLGGQAVGMVDFQPQALGVLVIAIAGKVGQAITENMTQKNVQ